MEKFIGGLRWGKSFWKDCFNVTFPFASLRLEEDRCIITRRIWWVAKTTYVIDYKEIEYISLKSFLFQKGILFVHKNKNIPPYLIFWTFHPNKVIKALEKHNIQPNHRL